jgi:hypothetical protein
VQVEATRALANLATGASIQDAIVSAGAIAPLILLLGPGKPAAVQKNAAAALANLAASAINKDAMAGAITSLHLLSGARP